MLRRQGFCAWAATILLICAVCKQHTSCRKFHFGVTVYFLLGMFSEVYLHHVPHIQRPQKRMKAKTHNCHFLTVLILFAPHLKANSRADWVFAQALSCSHNHDPIAMFSALAGSFNDSFSSGYDAVLNFYSQQSPSSVHNLVAASLPQDMGVKTMMSFGSWHYVLVLFLLYKIRSIFIIYSLRRPVRSTEEVLHVSKPYQLSSRKA